MKSVELKKLYKEIGQSIYAMNTVAVSLSLMPDKNVSVPKSLRISWDPQNIDFSKRISRSYVEKSAMVYAAESFFEYLNNISKNDFWRHSKINFIGNEKKAERVYKFLKQIPEIEETEVILSELLCHWRNKIVHLSSNANLTKNKVRTLLKKKDEIYKNVHHFDVEIALDNYKQNQITLKDSSTLITMVLKCAEKIDNFFIEELSKIPSSELLAKFLEDQNFKRMYKQPNLERRNTQLKVWISTYLPFTEKRLDSLVKEI